MILSLDASLSSTGYCVMKNNNEDILTLGKIVTKKGKQTEEERVYTIVSTIEGIVKEYGVTKVAIENQFLHKNPKTTMQLSRLRGALVYMLMANNCIIEHIQPSSVRKLMMDNGSASKEEVASFIQEKYKEENKVIELGEFCDRNCKAKNSDIYDAIAIALAFKHII